MNKAQKAAAVVRVPTPACKGVHEFRVVLDGDGQTRVYANGLQIGASDDVREAFEFAAEVAVSLKQPQPKGKQP